MYQPLADLLRPTTLDEVYGQEHILGEGAVLRRLIESGNVPNMVFYGPSGTGKTTVANIRWIMEKAREFQKNIYFCFIDYAKAFDCVDHSKLWKILIDGNTRPPDLPLENPICRSGGNSYNWTWNDTLVPNRKRSASRLYIVTLLI